MENKSNTLMAEIATMTNTEEGIFMTADDYGGVILFTASDSKEGKSITFAVYNENDGRLSSNARVINRTYTSHALRKAMYSADSRLLELCNRLDIEFISAGPKSEKDLEYIRTHPVWTYAALHGMNKRDPKLIECFDNVERNLKEKEAIDYALNHSTRTACALPNGKVFTCNMDCVENFMRKIKEYVKNDD